MQKRSKFERFLRAVMATPVEAALFIPERISKRHEYQPSYQPDPNWEARLHSWLGAPWPCPERAKLDLLWRDIASELQAQGLRVGRQTYGEYSDAEISLARAAWCTVLHQRPSVVVETGVARGVTSRIVLEALNRNDLGHLWSIDLPHLFEKNLHAQTGAAVPDSYRRRWTYIEGSSRRRLPSLLRSLVQVDLFIHDSLHTARNTRFRDGTDAEGSSSGGSHDCRRHKHASGFRQLRTRLPIARNPSMPSLRQGHVILRARSQTYKMATCIIMDL